MVDFVPPPGRYMMYGKYEIDLILAEFANDPQWTDHPDGRSTRPIPLFDITYRIVKFPSGPPLAKTVARDALVLVVGPRDSTKDAATFTAEVRTAVLAFREYNLSPEDRTLEWDRLPPSTRTAMLTRLNDKALSGNEVEARQVWDAFARSHRSAPPTPPRRPEPTSTVRHQATTTGNRRSWNLVDVLVVAVVAVGLLAFLLWPSQGWMNMYRMRDDGTLDTSVCYAWRTQKIGFLLKWEIRGPYPVDLKWCE